MGPGEKIYVSNDASPGVHAYSPGAPDGNYEDTVTVYAAGARGNVAPVATIDGIDTGLGDPQGIAVDSGGRIYVTNRSGYDGKTVDSHGAYQHWQSITVYAADANGDAAPIATIKGAQTGLTDPNGVTVGPDKRIYVAMSEVASSDQPGAIAIYQANSNGDVKPSTTITDAGAVTELCDPTGISLDSTGRIYVANRGSGGSVTVYASGTDHNAAPIFTIADRKTRLSRPSGLALDAQKNIYVVSQSSGDNGIGSVSVFAAGGTGDMPPDSIISLATNQWPTAMTTDADGDMYV
ncbi:MAG: hypothetical protein ACRETL_09335, partial [Gammaproteobacteria bacterium]